MTIFEIKEKLRYQEFEICLHAFEEAVDDLLSLNEVTNTNLQNAKSSKIIQTAFDVWCIAKAKSSIYMSFLIIMIS